MIAVLHLHRRAVAFLHHHRARDVFRLGRVGDVAASPVFFIMGQSAPSAIFMALPSAPFFIIGHESPQQSQFSWAPATTLPLASFFPIGHESPLQQQQHDMAAFAEAETVPPRVKANAATASANIIIVARDNTNFFFISIFSINLEL